ncbi:MAG TPA: DnaJ family domain-containing protein [Steroidobacteraceae bacterium]|nr:DnaJ family domain-containing protein [Steroidobacteraceae bacterium]
MQPLDQLVEARIREAASRGEFDNLPGAGRPVALDDDRMVPEELRVAYRLLRNSGHVPPELELRREIHSVEALLVAAGDPAQRSAAVRRLQVLWLRLEARGAGTRHLELERDYFERVLERLARD